MRIAIDGLHLFGSYSGVHFALTRLVEGLRKNFREDELLLYVPRDFHGNAASDDPGLQIRRTWFPGRWRGVRTLWRNFRLQAAAYRDRCDLLHGPTYVLPAMLSMPSVVTVHDTIALSHPAYCTPGSARLQKRLLPRSAKVARRILVPTHAVKAEVEKRLQINSSVIDVVPWGVGADFHPVDERGLLEEARQKWVLPERFVLFVGTLEPKKNIEGLVKSFFAAKAHRKLPHSLVLAGQLGWGMDGLKRLIHELNAQEYVFFTGYVPAEGLTLLYNLADLFVLPSHIEGFGLPLLEAMACGCPALISNAPALVEVAGGAARVWAHDENKPFQPMREALEELLVEDADEPLRKALRVKGLERAKEFTWTRTAELTRACYARALES